MKILREKGGISPEVTIENIKAILEGLKVYHHDLILEALKPESLEVPPNAPDFSKQIKDHVEFFKHPVRKAMAKILAEASESGAVWTMEEITNKLQTQHGLTVITSSLSGHLDELKKELEKCYLKLDIHIKRRRSKVTNEMEKTPAYRLAWNDLTAKIDYRVKTDPVRTRR